MISPDALARLEALADALGLDGLEHPEIHDVFYVFMNETGETDLRALLAERKALVEALEAIERHARGSGDGSRTFDECISALGYIDDLCRAAAVLGGGETK